MLPKTFLSRRFASLSSLAYLAFLSLSSSFLLAQDVQMVPDSQDRESAKQAQKDKDTDKDKDQAPVATFKTNVDVVQLFFNVDH